MEHGTWSINTHADNMARGQGVGGGGGGGGS